MNLLFIYKKQSETGFFLVSFFAFFSFHYCFSQPLTGTKTIPGNYATISAAITDLNAKGVGVGGVTFNVSPGHAETSANMIISATGTPGKPIIFQKSGIGTNPLVTAATGVSTTLDGIIILKGCDYITLDGIDLKENTLNTTSTTRMEFGYGLLKNSASDGCQYNTVKNCSITLNHLNTASTGIYGANHTPTSTTTLSLTGSGGANSYNIFSSNTITDVNFGFQLTGYNSLSYNDVTNDVGSAGANTISSFGGNSVACYGIYATNQSSLKIANNIISGGSSSGSGAIYGIYLAATSSITTSLTECYLNTISDLIASGAALVAGMSWNTVNNKAIYQNTIKTLSTAGDSVIALSTNTTTSNTTDIYRNKIYDISTSSVSGKAVGIAVTTGITVTVYNNIIGDIRASTSANTNAVVGLNLNPAVYANVYFNSVYLSGSGGSNFGSSGIYAYSTPIIRLNNNLVVNQCTPSGTGVVVAYRRSSSTLTSYSSLSSNNLFYAGTPSSTRLIYWDGTNSIQTICSYLDLMVSPRDVRTVSENPAFLSTVSSNSNYLHLDPNAANLAESGGAELTGITSDFDATGVRPSGGYPLSGQSMGGGFKPDIGADEVDAKPGVMIFMCATTTQVGGIATQGGTNQSIIRMDVTLAGYTSALSVTQFTVNATGTTAIGDINAATSKIYSTGTSQIFSTSTLFGSGTPLLTNYTINGTKTLECGINYFWLTYDVAATAVCGNLIDGQCASMIIGGLAKTSTISSPTGNKIIKGGCNIVYYTIDNTLPASCSNYPSFSAAIADLNMGNPSCPTIYYVTAGQVFNEGNMMITTTGSASSPITFQKSGAGANPKILSTVGVSLLDALIKLSGTDYITFDAIDLEDNPANTSGTMRMEWGYALLRASSADGCQNVVIRNCTVKLNKANTSTAGIYGGNHNYLVNTPVSITSFSGTNSNNKFYSNTFSNVYSGILLYGFNHTAAPYDLYDQNSEIGVSGGNTFSDYGGGAVISSAVFAGFQNNLKIANNTMGSSNTTGTANPLANLCGVYLDLGYNSTVEVYSNNITASASNANMDAYGIYNAMGGTGTSNTVSIHDNIIQGVSSNNAPAAIRNDASCYILNIYNNEIKKNRNTGGNTFTAIGTYSLLNNQVNIYNNTIHDNFSQSVFNSILVSNSGGIISIYSNQIYKDTITATTDGWFTGITTGTSISTASVHDNTIYDIKVTSSAGVTGPSITAITGSNGTSDIYSNTLYNLTCTNSATPANVYGINMSGTTTNIYSNSLYSTACSYNNWGIYGNTSNLNGSCTIHDNTIHDLTGINNSVYGIYTLNNGSVENIYKNTIYNLFGSAGMSTTGSTGMYISGFPSTTKNVYDNIIYNLTGGTTKGIYGNCSGAANNNFYRNKIYTLTANHASGTATGLEMNTGNGWAYNNFLADLKAPSGTLVESVYGIFTMLTNVHLFYNSVSLNASGNTASAFGTVGMYIRGDVSEEYINNLVVNNSTPGTVGGRTVAIRLYSSNKALITSTTTRNSYWSGTPSSNRLIYYDGTNSFQTLSTYASYVAPADQYILTVNPTFTSATDLHTTAGEIQDAGTPVAYVSNDIDLETRPLCVSPDIGADEYIGCFVLPIELVSFTAQPMGDLVQLNWETASEINNDYFTIEKSPDALIFSELEQVAGAGTSTVLHDYSAMDANPYSGNTYYRLKQTDFDGQITYSGMVAVNFSDLSSVAYALFNGNDIEIHFPEAGNESVYVQLMDAAGKLLDHLVSSTSSALKLNAAALPSGIYFVSIGYDGKTEVQKVAVMRAR